MVSEKLLIALQYLCFSVSNLSAYRIRPCAMATIASARIGLLFVLMRAMLLFSSYVHADAYFIIALGLARTIGFYDISLLTSCTFFCLHMLLIGHILESCC